MSDPVVEVRQRGRAPERYPIAGALEVGRDVSGVRLDDDRVSRRHLVLSLENGTVTATDQGSANGTYVNGVRILAPTVLRPDDVVRLGRTEIVLLAAAPIATGPPPSPPAPPSPPPPAPPSSPPGPPAITEPEFVAVTAEARPELQQLEARDVGAAVIRFRPGTAGEAAHAR